MFCVLVSQAIKWLFPVIFEKQYFCEIFDNAQMAMRTGYFLLKVFIQINK